MAKDRQMLEGHKFEKEVLRRSSEGMDRNKPKHLESREAVDDAIGRQPKKWDPEHPTTKLGRKFFQAVWDKLPSRLQKSGLKLYVSTGTSLDYWHGIDCFFAIKERGILITVSCDLKVKIHPDYHSEEHSADFVVERDDLVKEERLQELAKKIVALLAKRQHLLENTLSPT